MHHTVSEDTLAEIAAIVRVELEERDTCPDCGGKLLAAYLLSMFCFSIARKSGLPVEVILAAELEAMQHATGDIVSVHKGRARI